MQQAAELSFCCITNTITIRAALDANASTVICNVHAVMLVQRAQVAEPSSATKRAQQPQRSKWGFVPGEDDTLDLNLEKAGRPMYCPVLTCFAVLHCSPCSAEVSMHS